MERCSKMIHELVLAITTSRFFLLEYALIIRFNHKLVDQLGKLIFEGQELAKSHEYIHRRNKTGEFG